MFLQLASNRSRGDHRQQFPAEIVGLDSRAGLFRGVDAVADRHVGRIAAAREPRRIDPVEPPDMPQQLAAGRIPLHAMLSRVGRVDRRLAASTPKSTTPLGISRPFTGLSLPMLLRNLPLRSKRRIARSAASPASTLSLVKPMAVTRPSSLSSRQVSSSFPAPSKISICPTWPAYTAPSLATATAMRRPGGRPSPLQPAGGIEDLDFGIAGGIQSAVRDPRAVIHRDAAQRRPCRL